MTARIAQYAIAIMALAGLALASPRTVEDDAPMTWLDIACIGFAAAIAAGVIGISVWLWLRPVSPAARLRFDAELRDRDERLS